MYPYQVRIPANSHLRYMPLVYFLPQELIARCPTLRKLPRKFREVLYSEENRAIVESDQFLSEILDASALLAFPHFGFGGWKEDYTGEFPAWKLSYSMPLWADGLERVTGFGLQALLMFPSTEEIPFFDSAYIRQAYKAIVKQAIEEQGWQPILDALREMPCEEDFEPRYSNVRKDFMRKWYHTRSKNVKMVSLEAAIEDNYNSRVLELADPGVSVEEEIEAFDCVERFKATLAPKDREILELRMEGWTYEAIADALGYKNHSGVLKRMKHITECFKEYQRQTAT